jgi:hypothetical protein
MLNDPTLPPADREKKKLSATAAITASTDHRNQNQNSEFYMAWQNGLPLLVQQID